MSGRRPTGSSQQPPFFSAAMDEPSFPHAASSRDGGYPPPTGSMPSLADYRTAPPSSTSSDANVPLSSTRPKGRGLGFDFKAMLSNRTGSGLGGRRRASSAHGQRRPDRIDEDGRSASRGSNSQESPNLAIPAGLANGRGLTPQELYWLQRSELLARDFNYGLVWDRRWQSQPMGPRDENLRRNRREGTKQKVVEKLCLARWGDQAWGHNTSKLPKTEIHLFLDKTQKKSQSRMAPPGGRYLLGRYDVAVVKVNADLDRTWNFIKGPRHEFFVAHAAAMNVGESTEAPDFYDFAMQGPRHPCLDVERYLQAMEDVMSNVMRACADLGIEDFIMFPFGMGAFLRNLRSLDPRFLSPQENQQFRRALAQRFVDVFVRCAPPRTRFHLCIMFAVEEAHCNADALLRAWASWPGNPAYEKLRARTTVYPEGDSLSLAQELADQGFDRVMLLNGANRQLLGNHWFQGRARFAIDENLHRRSWRLAAFSYLLNGYQEHAGCGLASGYQPDELAQNAKKLGGKIHLC